MTQIILIEHKEAANGSFVIDRSIFDRYYFPSKYLYRNCTATHACLTWHVLCQKWVVAY